jgi:hypothetical protein
MLAEPVPHHAKRGPESPGDSGSEAPVRQRQRQDGGRRRIRCPACKWEPGPDARWSCTCLHAWNTFDTAGICPGCGKHWEHTQCPRCGSWSRHADWYPPEPDGNEP